MKPHRIFSSLLGTAWLCSCLICTLAATAAQPQVVAPPVDEALHKSVFIDSTGFGRDPFFPNSIRRVTRVTVPTKVLQQGELPGGLVLKGTSGTTQNRLAIINNHTVAVGEETEVRLGGQSYKVKVVEIRERSVMVSVNGMDPKELTLRTGF